MLPNLTDAERARYAWQIATPDLGEAGQRKLKGASVLISRVGGVGSAAAYYLAAAGVGRLVLAHAGNVRTDDLNRQILMTDDSIGQPRVESARRRLQELNTAIEVEAVAENISAENAERLVGSVELVIDAAPLFAERFAMNRAAVALRRSLVEAAMFEFDAQLTTILPGRTPCLACLYPTEPPGWKRQFPVFGAVAGVIGTLAAVEAIKVITGIGEPLAGKLLIADLRQMSFRTIAITRRDRCEVCGGTGDGSATV